MRMPGVTHLGELIDLLGMDRREAADLLLADMKKGRFHFTPAHLAYLYTGDVDHPFFTEIQWAATVYEWRWQFGAPMTVEAARTMAGIRRSAASSIKGLSVATIRKVERNQYPQITANVLLNLAVAYQASPLSLLNGMLMTYPRRGIKKYIGGGEVRKFRTNQLEIEDDSYNEEEFLKMKQLCIKLGLVPEGQVQFFEALSLYELAHKTDLDRGEVQYRPFPLSPASLNEYLHDEQTMGLAEGVRLPKEFAKCAPYDCDGVLTGGDAYYHFKVSPFSGYDYWRMDMAKLFGVA